MARKTAAMSVKLLLKDFTGRISADELAAYAKAVETMGHFVRNVMPRSDRDIQTVALMIEVAATIRKIVEKDADYEKLTDFYNWIHLALTMGASGRSVPAGRVPGGTAQATAGTTALAKQRQTFLARLKAIGITETAFDAGMQDLMAARNALDKMRFESQKSFGLVSRDGTLFSFLAGWPMKVGGEHAFVASTWFRHPIVGLGSQVDKIAGKPVPEETAEEKTKRGSRARIVAALDPAWPTFYRIDKIYRPFVFVPGYRSTAGGATGANAFFANPYKYERRNSNSVKPLQTQPGKSTKLFTFTYSAMRFNSDGSQDFGDQVTVTVRAGDTELLEAMTAVIDTAARSRQLQNLADTIQAGAELILDLLEFVPGVGQIVAGSRLAAGIIKALADDKMWDEIREFLEDPEKIVDETLTALREAAFADPDRIFEFMLMTFVGANNGGPLGKALEAIEARAAKAEMKATTQRGSLARAKGFKKIKLALGRAGGKFGKAVVRTRKRTTKAFQSAAARLSTRPIVAGALVNLDYYAGHLAMAEAAVDAIRYGVDKGSSALANGIDPRIALAAEFKKKRDEFKSSLEGGLETLSTLELPGEIVPLDLVTAFVVNFVVSKIAGRKGRLAVDILKMTGADRKIIGKLGEEVFKRFPAGDPNTYWKTEIVDRFGKDFQTSRDNLVAGLYTRLSEIFPGLNLGKPGMKPVAVTATPFSDAETNGLQFMAEDGGVRRSATPPPETVHRPLPDALRTWLEGRFGHDLSHVRVAQGDAVDTWLGNNAVLGAASGSVVYLSRDASPGTPLGVRALDHEIAHVLQRSGPRPLGKSHSAAAMQPSGAMRRSPSREAARRTHGPPCCDTGGRPDRGRHPRVGGRSGIGPRIGAAGVGPDRGQDGGPARLCRLVRQQFAWNVGHGHRNRRQHSDREP